ncbi:hypothetical protein C8R43DRAFT_505086 [Mycena crocata]|nr:hypothetical protein C8R43DRAFT_505086 [Mycena crocata]
MIVNHRLGIFIKEEKPERVCQWSDCPHEDPDRAMKVCARCRFVRYCSRACQRADWPQHRLYCHIPPVLDISAWMAKHYSLFHWALVEALRLRTDPTNLLHYCLFVDIEKMDRLVNGGISPSPFLVNFAAVMKFESLSDFGAPHVAPDESRIASIQADGGVGEGVVVFCVAPRGSRGSSFFQFQHHTISEIPPGEDSPSDEGWKSLVKGVVNGEIPISALSHMLENET